MTGWRRHLLLAAVVVTSLAVAVSSAWTAFERSLIPFALDGTVDDTEAYADSGFRLRIVTIDGTDHVADIDVATTMFPLDRVRKDAWSSTMDVTGIAVRLTPSAETWKLPLLALLLPLAAFLATRWLDRRTTRGSGPSGGRSAGDVAPTTPS
ncbi:MAG: hypothetical protein MUF83_11240 [Acidimicrobiales bacterium]|nr:hypothetical protein [Acidimicrobiales bacterium]